MILKYSKFFEGFQITRNLPIDDAFDDFIRCVKECNDNYSYSSCAEYKGNGTSDPDGDFMEIDEKMSESGWDQKTIMRLSSDIGQTTFNKISLYLKQSGLLDNFTSFVTKAFGETILRMAIQGFMSPSNIVNNWIPGDRKNIFKKINKFINVKENVVTIQYKKIIDTINLIMFISFDGDNEEKYRRFKYFI